MYNDYIYFIDNDTKQEKMFRQKCIGLLNFCSVDKTIEQSYNPSFYTGNFQNDYLSRIDISHILVKQYYIGNRKKNNLSTLLNKYFDLSQLEKIDDLLTFSIYIQEELLRNYLNNASTHNNILIKQKLSDHSHDKIIKTLNCIDEFYQEKNMYFKVQ